MMIAVSPEKARDDLFNLMMECCRAYGTQAQGMAVENFANKADEVASVIRHQNALIESIGAGGITRLITTRENHEIKS